MTPAAEGPDTLSVPPGWSRSDDGERIARDVKLKDFMSAIGIVNEIAMVAESLDHHPDIKIHGWNKLRLESTSHDVGQLTERDIRLADHINKLLTDKGIPSTPA